MKRAAIVFVLAAVLTPAAGAQRASRPADDWIATLEAPERVAGLKIPEVVAAMKVRPGDIVADLGAGSGLFVVPLSSATGANGKVLAVEIDRNFFPHIQRKTKAAGVTNVQTIAGDPTDPKLPEPVDVALLHDVLHHIENPAAYIKSLTKYLKPTAHIAIVDYLAKQGPHRDDPSLQFGKEEAATLLATIGFKPVDDVALFPDKYFVIYSTSAAPGTARQARPQGPCDIYAAAGTPCVTAHSTVRSLSSRYGGPLYQVKRADGRLLNIGVMRRRPQFLGAERRQRAGRRFTNLLCRNTSRFQREQRVFPDA
jgi:ubiquinone/menaquinone biosynthesis C-methylase UbiE